MTNVVFVVDMLKGFYKIGTLANPRMKNIISNVVDLLERLEKEGYILIFLKDTHERDDKEFKIFPKHCVRGTEETEVIDELKKFLDNPRTIQIEKTRYSGFFNTELAAVLKKEDPRQVIVVGVCTDICVLYTVAGLRMRDYKIVVPRDCVETFDLPGHPAEEANKQTLDHMQSILGAKIVAKAKNI